MKDKIDKIVKLKEKFEHLKELHGKRARLMKELEASSIFELCEYDLRPQPDRRNHFFLFEISSKKMIVDGTGNKILLWLARRGIDIELVFNYEQLNNYNP